MLLLLYHSMLMEWKALSMKGRGGKLKTAEATLEGGGGAQSGTPSPYPLFTQFSSSSFNPHYIPGTQGAFSSSSSPSFARPPRLFVLRNPGDLCAAAEEGEERRRRGTSKQARHVSNYARSTYIVQGSCIVLHTLRFS